MSLTTLLPPLLLVLGACSSSSDRAAQSDSLERLYEEGVPYQQFREQAKRRVESWNANYDNAPIDSVLVRRARTAHGGGGYRVLVVAEDGCGDSANTIPYLARFLDASGIDMRIVSSKQGRWIMEAHRSRDGRAATPTVLLLGPEFEAAGCWVERPEALHRWFEASKDTMPERRLYDAKYAWYDQDRGRETVREFVEMLEGAAAGSPVCARGEPQ
jgi:hypothetical protein